MAERYLALNKLLRASILHGRVQLASGDWTDWYLDAKQVTWGTDGFLATVAVADIIGFIGIEFDAIGGVSFGGAPMALGCASNLAVPSFAIRNERKDHGRLNRIVGPLQAGSRVVLVEDVVTTFASLLSAIEVVHEAGSTVVATVCLVNRGNPHLKTVYGDIPFVPVFLPADLGVGSDA